MPFYHLRLHVAIPIEIYKYCRSSHLREKFMTLNIYICIIRTRPISVSSKADMKLSFRGQTVISTFAYEYVSNTGFGDIRNAFTQANVNQSFHANYKIDHYVTFMQCAISIFDLTRKMRPLAMVLIGKTQRRIEVR